ncbi:MAG: large-conductance mechanosensitive channel protein MscL [Planctomycetaceae bacterium]|nr:large-conductance mechanosensitive channel protein MscL [Planctomycetaceae bacterium]
MKFIDEFKAFAMRGNVVDMAVGIIIGVAFGKIVTALVNNIIMPPLGWITGGLDFSSYKIVLKKAAVDAAGKPIAEVAIGYGSFVNTIVEFIIIALAIFVMVKMVNRLWRKPPPPAPAAPPATTQELLLTEIRDILKTGSR